MVSDFCPKSITSVKNYKYRKMLVTIFYLIYVLVPGFTQKQVPPFLDSRFSYFQRSLGTLLKKYTLS